MYSNDCLIPNCQVEKEATQAQATTASENTFPRPRSTSRHAPHFICRRPWLHCLCHNGSHGSIERDGCPQTRCCIGPVKGTDTITPPFLNCGMNAQLATMVVPANSNLVLVMEFYWRNLVRENMSLSRSLSLLTLFFTFLFPVVATITGPLMTRMGA
jgi:hypothetical protein